MADDDGMTTTPRGSTPVPDPTELTDRAIAKALTAMRDYVDGQLEVRDERLDGIDKATDRRLQVLTDMHEESKDWVANLRELHGEKFISIQTQFKERDIRAEREARDNKVAVDAAFAAQKEAAAKQDEANAKAIDKSEKATAETIKTNLDLTSSQILGLTKALDEVKSRVNTVESLKVGATEQRQVASDSRTGLYATIGLIITIALFGITILTFIIAEAAKGGSV